MPLLAFVLLLQSSVLSNVASASPVERASAEDPLRELETAPEEHSDEHVGAEVDAHMAENHHLAALVEAERLARSEGPRAAERLAVAQASVGLEREALATLDTRVGRGRPTAAADSAAEAALAIDASSALDAIGAIVEAARDRRIVVLNGSRAAPRHHAFATELARALRNEGFDTFAAEAFDDVERAVERGYPDVSTSSTPLDPAFGELVRAAIDLRYTCVAFEAPASLAAQTAGESRARTNAREIERARTLFARVFAERPEARLFLYVEGSHVSEVWRDAGGPNELAYVVARLAKSTGADPLTIDQTCASPRSARDFDDPAWRRAADSGRLASGPRLFRRLDSSSSDSSWLLTGELAGQVDLQVFHPPLAERVGRSDWRARGRSAVRLPWQVVEQLDAPARRLVQAFRADESEEAIPVDQFITRPGLPIPALLLPRGEHRLVVQDEFGAELARVEHVVIE